MRGAGREGGDSEVSEVCDIRRADAPRLLELKSMSAADDEDSPPPSSRFSASLRFSFVEGRISVCESGRECRWNVVEEESGGYRL